MNKRFFVIVFLSALILVVASFWSRSRELLPQNQTELETPKANSSVTSEKTREWVRLPREKRTEALPPLSGASSSVVDALSEDCKKQWEAVNAVDLQKFLDGTEEKSPLPKLSACAGLPKAFHPLLDLTKQNCETAEAAGVNAAGKAERKANCYQAFVFYRALIADLQSESVPAESITDRKLLSDKIIAGLLKGTADSLPYAERLLELEPNFVPAAKMAAVLQVLNLQGSSDVSADSTKVERAIERAERMDPESPQMYSDLRSSVQIASVKSEEERIEVAKRFAQSHEGTSKGAYMASYVEFKQGRFENAQRLLREAIQADPQNPDYRETQAELSAALKKGGPNVQKERIYSHSFSFDLGKLVP
jgi:tetratricopeptide (TPR) repeat protein